MPDIELRYTLRLVTLPVAILLAGCGPADPAGDTGVPEEDTSAASQSVDIPLIPNDAAFDQVNALVKDPARDPLPEDSLLAAQIRLGFQIVENTPDHAARFVGNDLSCGNCHLNGGQRFRRAKLRLASNGANP